MRKILLKNSAATAGTIRLFGLFMGCLFLASAATAQTFTVTGKVMDENGVGLPGATVLEKGTTNGTVTDVNGNYSLVIAGPNSTLVMSFVGYTEEEIAVNGRNTIDATMAPDITSLQEIVVVGYGTQKRSDIINAVSTIDAEQIAKTPTPSFTQALQGTVSGVQMTASNGEPGGATRIMIRGTGSVTSATEPLFIIDGIQLGAGGTDAFNFINPQDIESVTVLKDAGATAIYGSRGANGVIIVTTKTGKAGQKSLNFSFEAGATVPINDLELANADEWRSLVALGRRNSGLDDPNSDVIGNSSNAIFDTRHRPIYRDQDLYNTTNTDWVDLMQENGRYEQYTFSSSNATEKTSYFLSGQYRTQEGNFGDTQFDRYTGRLNVDFNATDYLKLGVRYSIIYENDVPRETGNNNNVVQAGGAQGNLGNRALFGTLYDGAIPVLPQTLPDGTIFDPVGRNNLTYLDRRDIANRTRERFRNIGSIFAELSPIEGLVLRAEASGSFLTGRENRFTTARVAEEETPGDYDNGEDYIFEDGLPRLEYIENEFTQSNLAATLSYTKTFKEKHNFTGLLGVERVYNGGRRISINAENASSPQEISELGPTIQPNGSFWFELNNSVFEERKLFSHFGRLTYNFDNKYYLEGTMRRDGSSVFADGNEFDWFPSVSAGWVASRESFYDLEVLNYLKLSGSYGISGNQEIPTGQDIDGFLNFARFPTNLIPGGLVQNRLASNDIRWERTSTINAALDFELFNSRISGSIGYYQSKSDDILLDIPLALSQGVYPPGGPDAVSIANVGTLKNWGWEFEISSQNISTGNFTWTTSFNISTNRNEVERLFPGFDGSPTTFTAFGGPGSAYTTVQEGAPIGEFYLPVFAGYDRDGVMLIREVDQEILEATGERVFTGRTIRNLDNAFEAHSVIQEDKTGLPTFFGGIGNTFSYKGLSIYFQFTFQGGNYIYDNMARRNVGVGQTVLRKDLVGNTWTPDNTNAEYPVLAFNSLIPVEDPNVPGEFIQERVADRSDKWLEKGDFIRLRTISLSYDFSNAISEKTNNILSGLSVFVNLQNVATFSRFDTVDPEFVQTGSNPTQRNLAQGVINSVPLWQVFTASGGVNIKL